MKLFVQISRAVPACLVLLVASSSWGAITFKALNSFSAATGAQPFGQLLRSTNGLFYGTTASGGDNGFGVIYSATTAGALNLVASFDGTNGAQPLAGLIQGPDGNFYGTTSAGGAFGKGTIFQATADGTLTNLFSFDGTNGTRPLAPLTFGADGNFYGTTSAGGAFDLGTIYRMDGTGNVSLVFSFNGTNGAQPAGGLIQVADGTFYGTTQVGGGFGYGTIFTITPAGTFTPVYSFKGGIDGAGPQSGLTVGSNGALYGTTSTGGTNVIGHGAGTVFVLAPGFSTLHRFIGSDGANPSGVLVEGASGVMYGTTRAGGLSGRGAIFSVNMGNGNLTNLFSFNGNTGSSPAAGLTGGTNGNFFGVCSGGGKNGVGNYFQLSGFSPFIIQSPPSPVTLVAGDTLVLRVIAGGTAPLSYQWELNSNNVVNGRFISGATSPNLTVSNITTMQAGLYNVTVRNSAGQVASTSASVSVVPRPIIGFTAPQREAQINSSSLTVRGTTSGEVAVARVYFQFDDGGWQLATSSDNWVHWRANVTMPQGNHVVEAFAESVLSTFSKTNSVAFTSLATSAPVVVEINGDGTVNPNLDGQFLQVGKSYSMTAIPAIGSLFAGWKIGDVETNAPKVVFVMQSNLVLQANFRPDLFFTGKGSYNGLFQTADDVSPTNTGLVALTLNSRGAFTGRLRFGVTRTAFAKSFDMDGNALVIVPRRNLNPLAINLQLLSDESTNAIVGTVSDGVWIADLNAYRAVFNAKTNPAPAAGRYTLAIFGDPSSTDVPGGDSWGALTMNPSGMIVFSGFLSDNTQITQTIPISREGNWPFYIPLYGSSHGLISGWLTFADMNSASGSITGNVTWFKPEIPTAKYYPEGFRVSSDAIGSSYVKPPDGVAIVDFGDNPAVTFIGGDLTNSIVSPIALDNHNRVTNSVTIEMNLSFSVTNGVFRGNVTDPNSSQPFPVRGVVLQNENSAAGYFLGPTQSGEVRIGE